MVGATGTAERRVRGTDRRAAVGGTAETAPTLRKHFNGHWFVLFGKRRGLGDGGSKWFGKDPGVAQDRYLSWAKAHRLVVDFEPVRRTRGRGATIFAGANSGGKPRRMEKACTVQEVAEQLWALVDSESGPDGRENVRQRLKRFLAMFGGREISSLGPKDFVAFKTSISHLSGNTKSHQLTYVRRLLNFAWNNDFVDKPFKIALLKTPPRGAVRSKAVSADRIRALLPQVAAENETLAKLMLLQFWSVLRPSEVPKIVQNVGHWSEQDGDGVYAFVGKTTYKTGELRRAMLTEEAMTLLKTIDTSIIQTPNAYRLASYKVGKKIGKEKLKLLIGQETLSPHFLRHSAASALVKAKVSEEYIRAAMGRVKAKVDRVYMAGENYSATRDAIAVLSQLVPLSVIQPPANAA